MLVVSHFRFITRHASHTASTSFDGFSMTDALANSGNLLYSETSKMHHCRAHVFSLLTVPCAKYMACAGQAGEGNSK